MVSAADRDVEKYVKGRVHAVFPADDFLGEEGGADWRCRLLWSSIRSTARPASVNGMYSWCISIAVLYRGEPVIGVVFDPNANELFHARIGGGAFCGAKPCTYIPGRPQDGVLGVGTRSRRHRGFRTFIEAILRDGGMFIRNGSGR